MAEPLEILQQDLSSRGRNWATNNARRLRREGNFDEAIALLSAWIETNYDEYQVCRLLSEMQSQRTHLIKKTTSLQKNTDKDLNNTRSHINLGKTLSKQGRHEEAEPLFDRTRLIDSENAEALCAAARNLARHALGLRREGKESRSSERFDKAEKILHAGIERHRQDPKKLMRLVDCIVSEVFIPQRRFTEAEELIINVIIPLRHIPQKTYAFYFLLRELVCKIQKKSPQDYHALALRAEGTDRPTKIETMSCTPSNDGPTKKCRPLRPKKSGRNAGQETKHGIPVLK